MRKYITAVLVAGALAAVPLAGLAATPSKIQSKPAARHAAAATHATKGTVKSVDESSLVITRPGKKGGEMKFTLDQSTRREGTIAPGANVSVRYREDGSTNVATAVTVQGQKAQASHQAPPKR